MSILQSGAVLNQANAGQTQVKVATAGVQRLLHSPNGPVKQVLLTSMPQQVQQTQGQSVQVQIPAAAQVPQVQQQAVQVQQQAVQVQQQAVQVQQQAVQVQPQTVQVQQQTVQVQPQTVQVQPQTVQTQVQLQPAMQPQTPGSEAKRITLVLQQPSQTATSAPTTQQQQVAQVQVAQQGQQQQPQTPTRLVLGQLPGGKLVLQGSQLAALTQGRSAGQTGGQPKVLTIQLQVQQQPNQQGGVKYQLVSGAGNTGSPQVLQISQGQGGQRVALPLKMLLQPQVSTSSSAGGTVSVVKVINSSAAGTSTTTTSPSQAIRITKASGEPASVRRVEILCKQEKANRIVAEAIAGLRHVVRRISPES
ncbi:hypothetical protein WMY93_000852 [Mugilogobius chulae]|uniref:Uncharacterized protein n=1 Tax=Mugilogobius chulae TaxID=88201 RepID=A0AAW0QFD8_9GOBI